MDARMTEDIYGVRTAENIVLVCGRGDDGLREAMGVVLQELPYGLIERGASSEQFRTRESSLVSAIIPKSTSVGAPNFWLTRECSTFERQTLGAFDSSLFERDLDNAPDWYGVMLPGGTAGTLRPKAAGLANSVHLLSQHGEGYLVRSARPDAQHAPIAAYSRGVGILASATCSEGERSLITRVASILQMGRFISSSLPLTTPAIKDVVLNALSVVASGEMDTDPMAPFAALRTLKA